MKRINSKKDIPWFDISNYGYIDELNDFALLEELMIRKIFHEENTRGSISDVTDLFAWEEVLNGQPNTQQSFDSKLKQGENNSNTQLRKIKTLSSNEAVFPVSTLELELCCSELEKKQSELKNFTCEEEQSIVKFSYSEFMNETNVMCNIALERYTDEEILMALKHHLPLWRKDLITPAPKKRFIKRSEITKVRDYRIIPFLDLMIWELQMGVSIPKRVISACVFPDGEFGEVDLSSSNGKVSNLLNVILSEDFSISKITGDFDC